MADVICRSCGESCFETNERDGELVVEKEHAVVYVPDPKIKRFDPAKACNATMIHMKQQYVDYGWESPYPDPSIYGDAIECLFCGAPLPDSNGRVKVLEVELIVESSGVLHDLHQEPVPKLEETIQSSPVTPIRRGPGRPRKSA